MKLIKHTAKTRKSVWSRAMDRYKKHTEIKQPTRIGFLIDATRSREKTWEQAQTIQAKMFRAASGLKAIKLRLVYFGGGCLSALGWENDAYSVAENMAAVRCRAGLTQIIEGLQSFLAETPEDKATAIILIGDCFEENSGQAERAAILLKEKGIKVFSFIEGNDPTAQSVFRRLSEITGGQFARFGSDLPLSDLCEGVALLTSGGEKALGRLKNKSVRTLLLGPKRD